MAKKLSDSIGQFATVPHSFIEATASLSPQAKWLFVVLRYHTGRSGKAFPSCETLEQASGLHRRWIAKGIRELVQAGWIERQRRFGGSSIYTLKIPINATIGTNEDAVSSASGRTVVSANAGTITSANAGTITSANAGGLTRLSEQDSTEQDILRAPRDRTIQDWIPILTKERNKGKDIIPMIESIENKTLRKMLLEWSRIGIKQAA